MADTDWAGLRDRMVRDQLERRSISDASVLDAMRSVPRERFIPAEARSRAYQDHALAIGEAQTISQPYMVAAMTEALHPGSGDRVLEIGTGSGYQAAVLAHLAAEVFTVERIERLADRARRLLEELGVGNVRFKVGDGTLGWPEEAPFDGILVTAASPSAPDPLMDQLEPEGGRLVIPVGDRNLQELVRIERRGTQYTTERLMGCRFVPLLGQEGWKD